MAALHKRHRLKLEILSSTAQSLEKCELWINQKPVFTGEIFQNSSGWENAKWVFFTAQNTFRLVLKGQAGLKLRFQISETTDAGKIFQVFPTLPPSFPGVLHQFQPEEGDPVSQGTPSARLTINQEQPLYFEKGLLTVVLKDQNQALAMLQSQYKAKIIDQLEIGSETFYYIQPDLTTAPLTRAQDIVTQFNQVYGENYQHLRFSSLNAMRLFLIQLEILATQQHLVQSVSLNGTQPQLPIAQSEVVVANTSEELEYDDPFNGSGNTTGIAFGSSSAPKRVGKSWFLQDSRVPEAWRYSMGTGVKVAWLDFGYGKPLPDPSNGVSFFSELEDRRKLGEIRVYAPYKQGDTHGIDTLQAGFAEKGNQKASAGTAPNAQLALYSVSSVKQFAQGINDAVKVQQVQVVGMNQAFPSGRNVAEYPDLMAAIAYAIQQKVPVLMPAHNFNRSIVGGHPRAYLLDPAGDYTHPAMQNAIVVGAAGFNFASVFGPERSVLQNSPDPIKTGTVARDANFFGLPHNQQAGLIAWFETFFIPTKEELREKCLDYTKRLIWESGCFGSGSGFDHINKSRLIWVPGQRIMHLNQNAQLQVTSGTSMAMPFATGIVALMKSRNPDLTPAQILGLLRANSFLTVRANPEMKALGLSDSDSKMVDAVSAVIRAIDPAVGAGSTLLAQFQDNHRAKEWLGEITANKHLLTTQDLLTGNNSGTKLRQTVSNLVWNQLQAGKKVRLTGWKGNGKIKLGSEGLLPNDQIEILEVEDIGSKVPEISSVQVYQQGTKVGGPNQPKAAIGKDLVIQIKGKYFYHNASKPLRLKLVGQEGDLLYLLSPTTDPNRTYISPDGTLVQFFLPANSQDSQGKPLINAVFYTDMAFQMRIEASQSSNLSVLYPNQSNDTIVFTRTSPQLNTAENTPPLPEQGFGILSVTQELPPAALLPQGNYVYDQVGNRWMRPGFRIQVDANDFAGIRFTQPIRDLEVKIGPVLVPITSILNDLAVMGIPDNLPAGVHDVVIKASGQTLTLEQAVEKVSQAIPPTPEPTAPPSGNPGEYESVRVFNIEGNDEGRVYLNDQLILTAHAGEDNYASLGTYGTYPLHKDQRNEFRFELVNNGGGYTYGFELQAQYNGTAAYRDIQGSPGQQNKVWPDGSEDQRQGVVYHERMITNSKFSPVGTGPFWMKVFNLNPDESLTIQTYNDTNDIQWPDGVFRVGPPINSQEISKQLPIQPFDPFSSCGIYDPNFECWNPRYIGFYFENPTGPYNVGIEVYKGINLVYRNIQGQRGVWGAEENQEGSSNPYIQDYVAHQYRHYPAGY